MADTAIEVRKSAAPMRAASAEPFQAFRNEMDRFFDQFWRGAFALPSLQRSASPFYREVGPAAMPAVDVSEDDEAYEVEAELPGLSEKDIEIRLAGSTLTIKGEKHDDKEESGKNYHLTERRYGMFERAFALPEGIDRDKIEASFENGILRLTLPKAPEAVQQQKKIEIKTK